MSTFVQKLLPTLFATVGIVIGSPASAQATSPAWPTKPIRVIVPYPAGGNADTIARFVADKLGAALGETLIVDNKGGAGGTIGAEAAARSAPDGYTFIVAPTAVLAITPHLRNVRYDPLSDFTPIAQLTGSYTIATARKDAPFNTIPELVAAARKDPGKFTFGSAGPATATHLAGEMLKHKTGIDLLHVPYKGSAEALSDLIGGRIDLIFDPVSLPRVKSGTVKAIAVFSRSRHPELPDVPTLKEQGVDIDTRSWFGLFAPKGTPKDVVQRMAAEAEKVLSSAGTREQLLKFSQYPDFVGPQAFEKQIKGDSMFFKQLIEQASITVQ